MWCLLIVVRRSCVLLFVMRCSSCVVRCYFLFFLLMFVLCFLLFVVCCLWRVAYCLFFVVCLMLCVGVRSCLFFVK